MSNYKVDLNADLAEGAPFDKELIPLLSSANIACGFHAGKPELMQQTVKICKEHGVNIGAHPGFPDSIGFGRREMSCSKDEIISYILYQLGALSAFCKAESVKLHHVKAHGALYNMTYRNMEVAMAVAEGIALFDEDLIVFTQANSLLAKAAEKYNLKLAYEVFGDRAYDNDGSLTSRAKENSVLEDEKQVLARVIKMVIEKKVETYTNQEIDIKADTICLHGDNPAAINLASLLRQGLLANGIEIIGADKIVQEKIALKAVQGQDLY